MQPNIFPLVVPAIRVVQPIGVYYVVVLSARILLSVAYSDTLNAALRDSGVGYDLTGTQRNLESKRLKEIAEFINRPDSAFPNTVILAANFRMEDGLLADDDFGDSVDEVENDVSTGRPIRWTVSGCKKLTCETGTDRINNNNCNINIADQVVLLTIPTEKKLAAVIDGQHRLFAFANAEQDRLDMPLICSVFLDLPKPIQAQLFATINSTQKPVSKSLTYELFGYNLEEEDQSFWAPDKLAVFLTRKLGTDNKSPLKGRIVVAPLKDEALEQLGSNKNWKVSTAVVVEGIMRLITSNPRRDTNDLLNGRRKSRKDIGGMRTDRSPLREAYLNDGDVVIYTMVLNYLLACEKVFWDLAPSDSFIIRTVGIQALFDILRELAEKSFREKNISESYFVKILSPASGISFAGDFRNASGAGRTTIKKALRVAIGLTV